MVQVLNIILGTVIYGLLIALVASPLVLIVVYPEQAEHFTEFGKTLTPCGMVLLLCVVFSEGLKAFFTKLIHTLGRVKSVSAGGAAVELQSQEFESSKLSKEDNQAIADAFRKLSGEKEGATNLARYYFLRYVVHTIYGSQYRFLEALRQGPLDPNRAISFYSEFLASVPEGTEYSFDRWIGYLFEHSLVLLDDTKKVYTINSLGELLLDELRAVKFNTTSLLY